MITASKTKK